MAILGCGNVGRALAVELLYRGRRMLGNEALTVWSRSAASVRLLRAEAQEECSRLRVVRTPCAAAKGVDILVLCVADDAIAGTVRRLETTPATRRAGPVVLTTNGFLPLSTLAPLERVGWSVGRMHPLAPVPPGATRAAPLHRARFALQGDVRAVHAATRLVRGIRGIPFLLADRPGTAQAYHAGVSLLGGGFIALLHEVERFLAETFQDEREVRAALTHFVGTILWYAYTVGPERTLTGAISRGSEAMVRGHLESFAAAPRARSLYAQLGETMLDLARARGSIRPASARRIRRMLRASARRG